MSPRDRALSAKTLVCLLQSMVDKKTVVELRNETTITGIINNVDACMNVEMKDVTLKTPSDVLQNFTNFFIQGRHIRFVQIPNDVDIVSSIKKQLRVIRSGQIHKERLKPVMVQINTELIRQGLEQRAANERAVEKVNML